MVRLATFNVENLFTRYRFRDGVEPRRGDGFLLNDTAFESFSDDAKHLTAQVLAEVDADVWCLQEVESLQTLDKFCVEFLPGYKGRHAQRMVIEGHDPRGIDVAVISRLDITAVRSWRHLYQPTGRPVFSRDCLGVDIDVGGNETLSVYVNHFKSMIGGRDKTRATRERQVAAVRDLVEARHGPGIDGLVAIVGDFNDYAGSGTSLGALLDHGHLHNPLDRLTEDERWTHYWAGGREYRQLDYLLLSDELDARVEPPTVFRKGLPRRATRYSGERFDDVGDNTPKASDHCPVVIRW